MNLQTHDKLVEEDLSYLGKGFDVLVASLYHNALRVF